MEITINTKRMTNFIRRHKEGVIVGAIAILVIHRQALRIAEMDDFLRQSGLHEEFQAQL